MKVGVDLFIFDNRADYMITVDYFSNFWELDYLNGDATSRHVINKLKAHFARHGIPKGVVSDKGPQFSSIAFQEFAAGWEF